MQIITNVVDIRIDGWSVDVVNRCVAVNYSMMTDQNDVWQSGIAYFWETMPPPIQDPITGELFTPDSWYQLPAEYVQVLTQLTLDARTALLPRIA